VTGLQPGEEYSFRVVAINGISHIIQETRSDPHTVTMEKGRLQFRQNKNSNNSSGGNSIQVSKVMASKNV